MTQHTQQAALLERLAIEETLVRYGTAIDTQNFDLLDTVFTPDATLDYRISGGARGPLSEAKAWLAKVLVPFTFMQHMIGNLSVEIDGDRASSVCYFYNPMTMGGKDGKETSFVCGGFYRDQLVRTADGWRISERVDDQRYMHTAKALPLPSAT